MTETQMACLMRAVNLARERQIEKLSVLREVLLQEWDEVDVSAALKFWMSYEKTKKLRT